MSTLLTLYQRQKLKHLAIRLWRWVALEELVERLPQTLLETGAETLGDALVNFEAEALLLTLCETLKEEDADTLAAANA